MKHLFAVAALAFLVGCISISDDGGSSRFYQSNSPTGMGAAIFTKNVGFQDTGFDFSVRDPKIGAKKVEIGFVGDQGWQGFAPKNAVWSKDGSVIAVQSADAKSWSHVYDFKQHDYALSDTYPLEKRAAAIEKLLKSRGGIGPKVLDDWAKFDKFAKPVAENGR